MYVANVADIMFACGKGIQMRLRNVTGSREMIVDSEYVVKEPENLNGKWKSFFGNENEIHIEIGMGKGKFLFTLASLHPDINYIGIEKYSTVLLRAVQKMEQEPLPNLIFIRMDAEALTDIFAAGEVKRIYLNFSDPWPKERHARRRLPSREFLARYDRILKKDGRLEFKTDSRELFAFALSEVEDSKWHLDACTHDLHHDTEMMYENVMTEYEERFSSKGNKICKYIISR